MKRFGVYGKSLMMAALISLCLTACATSRPIVEPCDHPQRAGETYRDWIRWAINLDAAIYVCNARIEAAQ